MSKNIRHCIGAISYCNDKLFPERYENLKKTFTKLKSIKREDNYIFLWDNGSSENVKNFLKSCDTFNDVYFSNENIYTNGLIFSLYLKAKEIGAEYITIIADDYLVYRPEAVQHCINFLDKNLDCGYIRMLKFEYDKIHIYDKMLNHPDKDKANAQRQFNQITKQKIKWEKCNYEDENYNFYKNNYHWSEFPNICRFSAFEKMIPLEEECGVMMAIEGEMMKNYHNLDLKTGVLDGGAFIHNQVNFSSKNSIRVSSSDHRNIKLKKSHVLKVINDTMNKNYTI